MNDQRQCILGKGGLFLVAPMICDARGIRTEVPSSKDPRFASGKESFWGVYRVRSSGDIHITDCDTRGEAMQIAEMMSKADS